jgi:predicted RNase H-like nuclease
MFTIDIIVKYTPAPLSVQRKELSDAQAVYEQVLEMMRSGHPQVLELNCEKMPDKKVAIQASEISAVQVSEKSGASTAGRAPGFVSLAE